MQRGGTTQRLEKFGHEQGIEPLALTCGCFCQWLVDRGDPEESAGWVGSQATVRWLKSRRGGWKDQTDAEEGGDQLENAASSYSWCVTGFSLAALNNALLVGVPLLDAMYGKWAGDIIVQLSVLQVVVWFPLMLIVFEARQAWLDVTSEPADADQGAREEGDLSAPAGGAREDGSQAALGSDFEWPAQGESGRKTAATGCAFWAPLLRAVGVKLARNPNVYASLLGVAWSSVACVCNHILCRWHLKMPSIIDGSIAIMSKTGIGMGMFSMGMFIGLQDKFIVCGLGWSMLSLVLRFIAAPAATLAGALILGLRGDLLRVTILQAALPQSIGSFVFSREYDLHSGVLSTAIIISTLASLPVLTAYYLVLGLVI
ncbi:probable auxin efflux carrier component 5b [Triticum dicoccoides]|uniref:probable auxin efflux carrier component 5b n=1 Tax=Triticum dicoccoides TaxID=85692 RepID=UPI00188FDE6F|nr:probable auxin efflux carrier component 5b [Triticum dicoccoides]